jgi:hypothetical protein
MKKILGLFVAIVTTLSLAAGASAASFTPGNIVIYRVGGTGTLSAGAALTNQGNIVWLDEFTQGGSPVQSIMMPTNYFGANSPLIADALATAEGAMTRSVDGRFLVLTGYGATLGQITNFALPSINASTVPRVVGLVDQSGHINTTTVQTNSLANEGFRSAASPDGTNLWFSGDSSGVCYSPRAGATSTQLATLFTNLRQINILSNQIYYSTAAGGGGIGVITNLMPVTTSGNFQTNLVGLGATVGSPFGFLLVKLGGGAGAFDTLYYADDTAVGPAESTPGNIFKYSLVGSTWVSNGLMYAPAVRGLTGYADNSGNVTVFATTGGSTGLNIGGGSLYSFVDSSGYNTWAGDGDVADLYDAPSGANGAVFRGVALVPIGSETPFTGPAQLSVGPITDVFLNHVFTGGPFSYSKDYSVANVGGGTMNWGVSSPDSWVTFSTPGGSLGSGASTTVTVTFGGTATSLGAGTNLSTITFTNSTLGNTGSDATIRPATLILSQLAVTPSSNYPASGPVGGPFTPASQIYTVTNGTANPVSWGAGTLSNSTWLTLSPPSGTIPSHQSTTVTVSINAAANALSRGLFGDTVVITNSSVFDPGNASRSVSLLIGGGFTSNNLVIYRAGDGVAGLANSPTPVFLDEYSRSGALIQSIPVSTNNYSCSGVATAEGQMTRSTDKQYVVFVGYGTSKSTYSGSVVTSLASSVSRVIGRVDGNGNVDVTTRLTDYCSGSNPRAAVSTNGVDMWVAGATNGIRHTSLGSTSSSDVCTNPVQNFRAMNIYSNQLYASMSAGTLTVRVTTIGTGLPTSDVTAVTLPGYSTTEVSPYNFVLFKLNPANPGPFDTLYVADDNGVNGGTAGGIYKWSLVTGNWTSNGFGNVAGARGLAGDVTIVGTTTNVNLFIVSSGNLSAGSGTLTAYTDTNGWNVAPVGNGGNIGSIIASASANERWDSVILAPEIPATAALSLTPGDFIVTGSPSEVTTNAKNYLVSDVSNSSLTWTATWTSAWLSLSHYGGTLAAGANTNITVFINANATSLANGTYLDTITYSNTVNNQGNTTRGVSLTITGAVANAWTAWQGVYFPGGGASAAGSSDPDGDGVNNTNEFLSGFNPNSAGAYPHVIKIVKSGNDINVTYLGASGDDSWSPGIASRTNVLEFTTGSVNGNYSNNFVSITGGTNILSGGHGFGTTNTATDSGGAIAGLTRYYRVRVLVP